MKILFDECVPKRLRNMLPGHDIKTAQEQKWGGLKNGQLLQKAAESFDAFITVDRNLSFQQNLKTLLIPVLVIHSESNRLKDLEPLIPELNQLLQTRLTKSPYHIGA